MLSETVGAPRRTHEERCVAGCGQPRTAPSMSHPGLTVSWPLIGVAVVVGGQVGALRGVSAPTSHPFVLSDDTTGAGMTRERTLTETEMWAATVEVDHELDRILLQSLVREAVDGIVFGSPQYLSSARRGVDTTAAEEALDRLEARGYIELLEYYQPADVWRLHFEIG